MSFDISRFIFDPWNDYCGVVMEQGRVQLDSDWNEWLAELNRRIRAGALHLVLAYRLEIGGYIERGVRNWDSTTLVERLELQVGKDLQFIRINGTLVGGLVGLLIFVASKWIAMF